MKFDSPVPAISIAMQASIVGFRPMTSMSPVKNGPVAPNTIMLSETAAEIVATSQPKALCSGTIITPGAARTPTPASVAENTIARTTHAKCTRPRVNFAKLACVIHARLYPPRQF
jgi:hypothetical protein